MAAGAPRSGRSQLLRTIAGALALAHSCADVHLYGIDCGNGALLPLADLPHCGAVVSRTQTERAARLLGRLAPRSAGGRNCSQRRVRGHERAAAASVTGEGAAVARLRVPLDRWEGFTTTLGELDHGRLTQSITRILGEGASVGIHLVMTGDRR